MKKNYAVYVRVSTDKDEQVSSIENQIDICRNWLERNGFEWDDHCIYKDEGISGTLFTDRPAIQLILEKARRKELDMVVFKSISRLARDLKDSLEIREVFIAHNVRIISIEEGYDSSKAGKNDIAFELWSLFAAQYSRTLSAGVSAALAAKVRRGEHIGKTPFGYRKEEGRLIIDKEEAKIISQIFEWYNQGWGYKRITKELNDKMILSKTGKKWQVTSIQRIISNSLYCGDFVLNQYGTIKLGGKKKQIRNPEEHWLIFRDHHPPIISREEWEKANQKGDGERKKITAWNEFRGVAKCSICGSNMVIVQSSKTVKGTTQFWRYLKCSQYRRASYHGCVNHTPIKYEDFRVFILRQLQEKGESLSFNFTSDLEHQRVEELTFLEKKLQQLQQKKKGLLDLYLDRLINKEEFESKRSEIEQEILANDNKIYGLRSKGHTESTIQTIKQAFNALSEEDQDLYHVIQTLIQEIRIHKDGTVDIEYTFQRPIFT